MANLQITLDEEQIQEALFGDRGMAVLMESVLNQVLQSEISAHLGAAPGERTNGRSGYRNARSCGPSCLGPCLLRQPARSFPGNLLRPSASAFVSCNCSCLSRAFCSLRCSFSTWRRANTRVGAGPITNLVATAFTRALYRLHRLIGARWFLAHIGIAVVLLTFATWILALWGGWSLVFLGAERAVVDPATGTPASAWQRVHFAGYLISTLGLGPLEPRGVPWALLADVASLSGLFLMTFIIAFLVPLAGGARKQREVALYVHRLGASPEAIILNASGGEHRTASLGPHLRRLTADLAALEQRYRIFPVLRDFHSRPAVEEIARATAVPSEAMTLLSHGLNGRPGVDEGTLGAARRALNGFLLSRA